MLIRCYYIGLDMVELLHCYYVATTLVWTWWTSNQWESHGKFSVSSHTPHTFPRESQTPPRGFPYFSEGVPAFKIRWFLTHTLLRDFLYFWSAVGTLDQKYAPFDRPDFAVVRVFTTLLFASKAYC